MQEVHADKVLMLAIGNNDYISYNKLFDRYYGRLCQYVYSLLMDRNDAEDVVQELFLNLWKNRGRIEIKENVSGYLYRMAKLYPIKGADGKFIRESRLITSIL